MKTATLLIVIGCSLAACDRTSSPDGDGTSPTTGAASFSGKGSAQDLSRQSVGNPRRSDGSVGKVMGQATERIEFAATAAPPPAPPSDAAEARTVRGDPMQYVDPSTAGAVTMVIRTGQAFIEVDKVDPAILKIRQLAAQVGGYITNSSVSGGRDQIRQATFELKVPAAKYDQAVGTLSTIGKVETVTSNAQDVGEEFVDVTARVQNARRLEERLISLLANRTGKLDEVLRVERELARVREEIERYEGRLRYLTARVSMSTLTITVHEPAPLVGNNPGENPIGSALRRAWHNFVSLIAGIIASLGILIPLGVIAAGGWFAYRRWKSTKA
ncbi:MAG: DUF4349 domain-containing protein [Gemmatimonadaceae bacterium]